jgi:hypothetical protein
VENVTICGTSVGTNYCVVKMSKFPDLNLPFLKLKAYLKQGVKNENKK